MRIARLRTAAGPRLGLVEPDGAAVKALPAALGDDPAPWLADPAELVACAAALAGAALDPRDLLCPILPRGKIIGVGLNFRAHALEVGRPIPERPALFFRPPTSLAPPVHVLPAPADPSLDYEGELAIVIGRDFHRGDRAAALAAIGGYCVANDLTLRAYAKPDQLPLAKGLDGSLPLGPWITAARAVADPQRLRIQTHVNGERRQDASTADMAFDAAALVVAIGAALRLRPGDLILTGSPHGSGAAFDPPRWLVPGDVVRIEIEGLGGVETRIEEPA